MFEKGERGWMSDADNCRNYTYQGTELIRIRVRSCSTSGPPHRIESQYNRIESQIYLGSDEINGLNSIAMRIVSEGEVIKKGQKAKANFDNPATPLGDPPPRESVGLNFKPQSLPMSSKTHLNIFEKVRVRRTPEVSLLGYSGLRPRAYLHFQLQRPSTPSPRTLATCFLVTSYRYYVVAG
jgi:hypothetical protein